MPSARHYRACSRNCKLRWYGEVVSVAENMATAKAAKYHLAAALAQHPNVNGVGIQPAAGGYTLVVNVLAEASDLEVPSQVNGVDVHVEVTGPGFPQSL
jgi:hypothetical protein